MIESVKGDIEVKGLQIRSYKQLVSLRRLLEEVIKKGYAGDIDVKITWYQLLGIGDDSNQDWLYIPPEGRATRS